MEKRNRYSSIYENKSSPQLRRILDATDYEDDAKQAAIWELERRGEATEDDLNLLESLGNHITSETDRVYEVEKYRTFWPRFVAIILDSIVIWFIGIAFSFVSFFAMYGSFVYAIVGLITSLIPLAYYILMHGLKGQTIGKMIMGVKLMHVDETRGITMKQAVLRDIVPLSLLLCGHAISWVSMLFGSLSSGALIFMIISGAMLAWSNFLWALTEIITMLVNEKSRALHDLIAKTVVIRVKE